MSCSVDVMSVLWMTVSARFIGSEIKERHGMVLDYSVILGASLFRSSSTAVFGDDVKLFYFIHEIHQCINE